MKSPVVFTTHIYQLEYLLNVRYLEVPADVIEKLGGSLKIRLICTINNQLTFQCGLMALGESKAYITLNKARLKKLNVTLGDEIEVKLEPDPSKFGMDVPTELSEWLDQDVEAKRRYDLLSPGKQRYIIYYVQGVKSPHLRMERTTLMMENLKRMPENKFSFRFLLGKDDSI